MFTKCPGSSTITRPTIEIKKCPECGEENEVFSDEMQVKCSKCGFTIYNNLESCIEWCKYAEECIGEEKYNKLMKEKEM
jgi:NADH pyrophosphatase NudC (nudix superfamily)